MAAHDHLSSGQFDPPGPVYHGSPHGFAEGDVIEPHRDRTHLGEGDKAAFGSTFPESAGYFGLMQARNPRDGQGRLFSSVYEVEPMSRYELHPAAEKAYAVHKAQGEAPPVNNMPIDRQGFRVKRHVAFVYPDIEKEGKNSLGPEVLQETPRGVG